MKEQNQEEKLNAQNDGTSKMQDKGSKVGNEKESYETWRTQWKDSTHIHHLRELRKGFIRKDIVENCPQLLKNTNQQIQKTQGLYNNRKPNLHYHSKRTQQQTKYQSHQ